jgi:sugar O-acyltransferase (sialic acid O-acetyltransferase NeuD family)
MKQLIILGTSGHSKVVSDIFKSGNEYKIIGYLTSDKSISTFEGEKVLGNEHEYFRDFTPSPNLYFFIAIGDNFVRYQVSQQLEKLYPNIQYATGVHPSAIIGSNVQIAAGTCIMPHVVINNSCSINAHCILNTSCSLDHDSVMEDFSSLAPGVVTGGNVKIGAFTAISIGAVIIHKIKIGTHTVIGAGSVVVRDIEDFSIAYGNPCRIIKQRKTGDKYL